MTPQQSITNDMSFKAQKSHINSKIQELEADISKMLGMPVMLSLYLPPGHVKNGTRVMQKTFIGTDGEPVLVNFDTVLTAVSKVYNVSEGEIIGHNRQPQNTRPRECLSYILYVYFEIYSFENIAFLMSNRNHSTIMHQIANYKHNLQINRDFYMNIIDRVKKEMGL